jgi:hypothetical protein
MPVEPTIGEGVIVEAYYPVDGRMANWWTLHYGSEFVGITHRGSGQRMIIPRRAFDVLIAKLRDADGFS